MPKDTGWKLLESRVVFDTYTKIEERVFETPDGKTKKFYIKTTQPAVCILALTSDNKIILVEQFRPGPNRTLNELPGGGVEDGETHKQAAIRELREETGYEGHMQFVTHCYDDAYSSMNRSCFVATNCKRVADQNPDESEFMRVKLFELPDFFKLIRSGQMTDVEVAYLGLDKLGLLSDA